MEGLRLLDESCARWRRGSRACGGRRVCDCERRAAVRLPSAGRGRREEEEDVLLDG